MRCIVTGATGFVGSHLVRQLLESGHAVLAIVQRSSERWRLQGMAKQPQLAYADLATITDVKAEICSFGADVVFHLAWQGGNSRKFLNEDSQVFENVPGSLELVRIAKEAGCKAFVFMGSSTEYGRYRKPVREQDPVEPTSLYALAKNTTSQLCEALCVQYEMRYICGRLFWAYGPMDDTLRMIPSVITKLLEGGRPSLTPGEQVWDFLYIDDVVQALIALARTESARGVFNIGAGDPITVRDVVTQIRDLIDPKLEIGFGDVPYPPDQVMHLEADVNRLRSSTGWVPQVSLQEGLRRSVEWYREQVVRHGV